MVDALTPELIALDCECRKKAVLRESPGASADDAASACRGAEPNLGCLRAYTDCDDLVMCTRGEPWRPPTCREGEKAAPMSECLPRCDGQGCPAKSKCQEDGDGDQVCYPER